MKWLALGIALSLLSMSSFGNELDNRSTSSSQCSDFFSAKLNRRLIERLRRTKEISSVWDSYDPLKATYLLTDGNFCVSVVQNAHVIAEIQVSASMSTQYINAYLKGINERSFPGELQKFLEAQKVEYALVLNTTIDVQSFLSQALGLDTSYDRFLAGTDDFLFQLLIHEGFHISGQFPGLFGHAGQIPWPQWAALPDRTKLPEICYNPSPEINGIYQKELHSIDSALRVAWTHDKPSLARQAIADFLQYRNQRYQKLKGSLVPSPAQPGGITCQQAEAIMELAEGSAVLLQEGTELDLGFSKRDQALGYISKLEGRLDDGYYVMGAAQLFLLRNFFASEFKEITHEIGTSQTWDHGISFQFREKFRI